MLTSGDEAIWECTALKLGDHFLRIPSIYQFTAMADQVHLDDTFKVNVNIHFKNKSMLKYR
tara:strand:+ start:439 stop:621 length:183 start_codon:yes stop_codon:yes gene_type:complete